MPVDVDVQVDVEMQSNVVAMVWVDYLLAGV